MVVVARGRFSVCCESFGGDSLREVANMRRNFGVPIEVPFHRSSRSLFTRLEYEYISPFRAAFDPLEHC